MKKISKNRKNKKIVLTLVATGLLGGCFDAEPVQRDVYNSKEECVKDWEDASLCEAFTNENKIKTEAGDLVNSAGFATNTQQNTNSGSNTNGFLTGYLIGNSMGSSSSSSSVGSNLHNSTQQTQFAGPAYYKGNRSVSSISGKIISPTSNHAVGSPVVKTGFGSSYSTPKSSASSTSRGGFSGRSGFSRGG